MMGYRYKHEKPVLPFILLVVGVFAGLITAMAANKSSIHTEKHGCEYVEKAECKQVWVRK